MAKSPLSRLLLAVGQRAASEDSRAQNKLGGLRICGSQGRGNWDLIVESVGEQSEVTGGNGVPAAGAQGYV